MKIYQEYNELQENETKQKDEKISEIEDELWKEYGKGRYK